jgi:hypothetical protein
LIGNGIGVCFLSRHRDCDARKFKSLALENRPKRLAILPRQNELQLFDSRLAQRARTRTGKVCLGGIIGKLYQRHEAE